MATVVSVTGIHEAGALLARLQVQLAQESRDTRQEEGGVVVESRRDAVHGGVTVTVAHLAS